MDSSGLARSVIAATSKYGRFPRLLAFLLGTLLTTYTGFVNAKGIEPLTTLRVTKALALLTEPDLMEKAFREGLTSYEEGDYATAADFWLAPAKHGHTGAQFSLGVAYATGNGVSQSLDVAIHWWNAAARQGHATAQLNLGLLYSRGIGVEKDLEKARDWWQRAADGGNAIAQFQLGAMAATGEGIPLDFDEAIRWWQLSAAQGYEQAIEGLQILERYGYAADRAR